jgi:hypothetical protein
MLGVYRRASRPHLQGQGSIYRAARSPGRCQADPAEVIELDREPGRRRAID